MHNFEIFPYFAPVLIFPCIAKVLPIYLLYIMPFWNISLFCTGFDIFPVYYFTRNFEIFCTSFPPDPRPAGPPGMEIWPNPLNLNLSQFQEAAGRKSGCNWIAARLSSSLTGWTPPSCWEQVSHSDRFGQPDLFKSNVWNISRQLTQLTRVGKPVSTPIWRWANRVVLTFKQKKKGSD